jgi:O-succinylhomoserine sulfhydrylase
MTTGTPRHRKPDTTALRPQTRLVHAGTQRTPFDETCEAIFQTSGYVYGSAEEAEQAFAVDGLRQVYGRFRNPTAQAFEDRLAAYEGAEWAYATTTGMAAVFGALFAHLKAGDRIVAPLSLFVSCLYLVRDLAPRWGIETTIVDGTDLAQWEEALSRPAAAVLVETPSNPSLDIVDIAAVAKLAHAAGAKVFVDNAFATPVLQHPFELGADVVIYSATKHIDGQGRTLGGIILTDKTFGGEVIHPFLRHTGPTISPFNAWLLLKGLETLDLRVKAQTAATLRIARALEADPNVERVLYPFLESHPQHELAKRQMEGGGTMLALYVKGGKDEAFRVLNSLRVALISNNLGDSKTLVTHPATTTHCKLSDADKAASGITSNLLRVSIGLEDADDLAEDFTQALAQR